VLYKSTKVTVGRDHEEVRAGLEPAGALCMGAGEYVSVSSQSDTERDDLDIERKAIANDSTAELTELRDIYVRRGLDPHLALRIARQLMAHDALGAHARDDWDYGSSEIRALQVAIISSGSALGGSVPLQAGRPLLAARRECSFRVL
jgi:VIT1/CCC1 family predicted Fe2+/Mn2+ transporter